MIFIRKRSTGLGFHQKGNSAVNGKTPADVIQSPARNVAITKGIFKTHVVKTKEKQLMVSIYLARKSPKLET